MNAENKTRIGGNAGITILPIKNVELDFLANKKVTYDNYCFACRWLIPLSSNYALQTKAFVDRVVSHNNIPNNTIVGASLAFVWGDSNTTQTYEPLCRPTVPKMG